MPNNLAAAIHPCLADLASTVVIRNETKLKILENDADMADAQQQIERHQTVIMAAEQVASSSRHFYANTLQQGLLDRMAFHALTKRLLAAHLASIDAHYIETENDLKAVILSVSEGDESLFAVHVPARPVDLLAA